MNILYRKQKEQVSYDNGQTWIDTGNYRIGEELENPSNCQAIQYRWIELPPDEGYYCNFDEMTKYTVQVEESSTDGIIWVRTGNQRQGETVIETNSVDCGGGEVDFVCSPIKIDNFQMTWNANCMSGEHGIMLNGQLYELPYRSYIPNGGFTSAFTLSDFGITTLTSTVNAFGTNYSSCSSIDSFFNTSNVTDMSYMFCNPLYYEGCINLSGWDTSKVTKMRAMHASAWPTDEEYGMVSRSGHGGYTYIYMPYLNTSNVTDMSYMFNMSNGIRVLDIRGWDISKVTKYEYMFNMGVFDMACDYGECLTIYLGDITQSTYNWWYDRIVTEGGLSKATIVYRII